MQDRYVSVLLVLCLWSVVGISMYVYGQESLQIVSQAVTGLFALLNLGRVAQNTKPSKKESPSDGNLPNGNLPGV